MNNGDQKEMRIDGPYTCGKDRLCCLLDGNCMKMLYLENGVPKDRCGCPSSNWP